MILENYKEWNCLIKLLIIATLIIFPGNIIPYENPDTFEKYKLKPENNKIIELDNLLNESYYEVDYNYSSFSTQIKAIAIYYPNIYLSDFLSKIFSQTQHSDVEQKTFIKYYENLKTNDEQCYNEHTYLYDNQINCIDQQQLFINQVEFAKNHGIYGFAFYVFYYANKIFYDKYIYFFLKNKDINFKFLFIIRHSNIKLKSKDKFKEKKYHGSISHNLIEKNKHFFYDDRYIKLNSKPVICIDNFKNTTNFKLMILSWRKEAKMIGFENLFIIISVTKKIDILDIIKDNIFDAGYELLPNYLFRYTLRVNFIKNYTFFSGLIYRDLQFKSVNNFTIYRGSTLENNFKIKNYTMFQDYSPEYFYIMNKIIINWTIRNYNESNQFIFINSWNNYNDGTFLEPEPKYGFGSINALSKALFNIKFKNYTQNFTSLMNKAKIAVQAHVYYEDLINEIITSTNNIPIKFDLYITTTTLEKKYQIKNYIKKNSKANNYYIKIVKNKGRDVFPLLIQMRSAINKYKYFCHIHTKKTLQAPGLGNGWRNYLYKNLLGSDIVSEILSDFENNQKLGFIFPETYYQSKESALKINKRLINSINYLINQIFEGYQIGKNLDFPAGNMFWAKSIAVYQIFKLNLNKVVYLEGNGPQTILFAIERIWLYIVKYNGYFYKKTGEYY